MWPPRQKEQGGPATSLLSPSAGVLAPGYGLNREPEVHTTEVHKVEVWLHPSSLPQLRSLLQGGLTGCPTV